MASRNTRLDRLLSKRLSIKRADVRRIAAQGRIMVDGMPCNEVAQQISIFAVVSLDGECVQDNKAAYIMMHKPKGYVSATSDRAHKTVLTLLKESTYTPSLHIAGRLDLNSTGLLLLTNDGAWSEALTAPTKEIQKVYRVELMHAIDEGYKEAFSAGMFFGYEGITTKPAKLEIIGEKTALVSLTEGRYHQIKRMFGRFRNPVTALHRVSVGSLSLDENLGLGGYRELDAREVNAALEVV